MSKKIDDNDRLKEIYESTVEGGMVYEGKLKNIDFYNLFCKAASQDKLYKIIGNNLCMFNYEYENQDSIMMVFFIPVNSDEDGAKNVAERVIEVVKKIETCFVTLDYLESTETKEDKFIYVVGIKIIGDKNEC